MRISTCLLSLTLISFSTSNALPDVWSVKGLVPSLALGEAQEAFQKARRGEEDLANTPQNALDTIAALEEELFQFDKKRRDALSAYSIRLNAMDDARSHDANLMQQAKQQADAERSKLIQESDRIIALLDRIANDSDVSAELVAQARGLEPRLDEINVRLADIRTELSTVKRRLDSRQSAREIEISDLKADMPDASDRLRILYRLDRARSLGLDAERKLSNRRDKRHKAATEFLQELMANAPEYLDSMTAKVHGNLFYSGQWEVQTDADADAPAQSHHEKEALTRVVAQEEDKLHKLQVSAQELRLAVRRLAQDIKYENDVATDALNLIANEHHRTILLNTGIEAAGTIAAAAASGGLSALAQFAQNADGLADLATKSGSAAVKTINEMLPADDRRVIYETAAATIGKTLNGSLVTAINQANQVYDLGLDPNYNINAERGIHSDAAALVAGDLAELAISSVVNELGGRALKKFGGGRFPAAKTTNVSAAKDVGIGLATTGLKAVVSARAQSLNRQRARDYLASHVAAQLLHAGFLDAKVAWLRIDAVAKAQKEYVEALRLRLDNGNQPKHLKTKTWVTQVTTGDRIELELTFSAPLQERPEISAPGLTFLRAKPADPGKRRWLVTALVDTPVAEATIKVALHSRERPWNLLDSNPATPPRLVSLLKNHWQGVEPGTDTNHVLKLKSGTTVLVIDLPQIEQFGCTYVVSLRPGQLESGIQLPADASYYDKYRDQDLLPFGPWDEIDVCVEITKDGRNPMRDDQGRMIAYAPAGSMDGSAYANGYLAPSLEEAFQLLGAQKGNLQPSSGNEEGVGFPFDGLLDTAIEDQQLLDQVDKALNFKISD